MNSKLQKKRWVPKPLPDKSVIDKISRQLGVNEVISTLIAQRQIFSFKEAESFFRPDLDRLHDPFKMKDMEKALQRIKKALDEQEKVLIYGDYDVDGTTAVALTYHFFRQITSHLGYYIPDRFREGYGISRSGIDFARDHNYSLIIALDCGIKAHREIQYAREMGIDVIVCDHHTVGDVLPPAFAILNPKQNDCPYPYKELSGCGIGYKLISGFYKKYRNGIDPRSLIDLVGVSTAADIVPITEENRILTYFALEKMGKAPVPGLKALMDLAGIHGKPDVNDLVFGISPRINAAGRIKHGENAVKMLLSETEEEALELAGDINRINSHRQNLDSQITEEALQKIESIKDHQYRNSTVLYDPNWHKGVIGIVASRLIENHFKPTVLLTRSQGMAVGSARSIPGFNLYNALNQCRDYLEQFGGHQAAAGLALREDKIPAFSEQFEKVVNQTISPDRLIPTLEYDLKIPLSKITQGFNKTIKRFGPFGPENMRPVFMSKQVNNAYSPRVVGKNHLKLTLKHGEKAKLDAVAFKQGDLYNSLLSGKSFDICYTLEENTWNNQTTLQLNIKDIQIPG